MGEPEIIDVHGDARYGWFDGVLTGPRPPDRRLREAQRELSAVGLGAVDITSDGGRFSLLPPEGTLAGDCMTVAHLDAFVLGLRALVAELPESGDVESSLRCTEVFADATRETLVLVEDGDLRAISRTRAVADADRRREPAHVRAAARQPIGWGRLLAVLALSLVVFTIVAWQGGWIDRTMSADAQALSPALERFDGMLAVEVEPYWGDYKVHVRRGAAYPDTPGAVQTRIEGAADTADRAAVNAVADGGDVFVRLEAGDGAVLASRSISLRPLLSNPEAVIEARLPGRIRAVSVRLALDAGAGE